MAILLPDRLTYGTGTNKQTQQPAPKMLSISQRIGNLLGLHRIKLVDFVSIILGPSLIVIIPIVPILVPVLKG